MYAQTVKEIVRVARSIGVSRAGAGDGRIESAMKEVPFLNELRAGLLEAQPTWDIVISPPRAACDVLINGLRINLKLTDCKSSDNSVNKPSIFYSITGLPTYPYSSTWNDFYRLLAEARENGRIKQVRDRATEYHYLVKNKLTGDVLLKPIFDIHTYISNPSNDLQINWRNEFAHAEHVTPDAEYLQKVQQLLVCLQKSTRDMIARTRVFAEADVATLIQQQAEQHSTPVCDPS